MRYSQPKPTIRPAFQISLPCCQGRHRLISGFQSIANYRILWKAGIPVSHGKIQEPYLNPLKIDVIRIKLEQRFGHTCPLSTKLSIMLWRIKWGHRCNLRIYMKSTANVNGVCLCIVNLGLFYITLQLSTSCGTWSSCWRSHFIVNPITTYSIHKLSLPLI